MNKRKIYIDPWLLAVDQYALFLRNPQKIEVYLEKEVSCTDRNRFHSLFLGAVRHQLLSGHIIKKLISKPPKPKLYAFIGVLIAELVDDGLGNAPKIGHHAVNMAKKALSTPESKLVNAVFRRAVTLIQELKASAVSLDQSAMALYYSHPEWLVLKWVHRWGADATLQLLEWNQSPSQTYFRLRVPSLSASEAFKGEPTAWDRFYRYVGGGWGWMTDHLDRGDIYVQDPATRLAPSFLDVKSGESVLDLCAAPGGKTLLLADALAGSGQSHLVAVDRPGNRLKRLHENLNKVQGVTSVCIGYDIHALTPEVLLQHNCPIAYDAVLLDVPCSNTGVLRRKPDVKLRLKEEDISALVKDQQALLIKAAAFVALGGRLAYSTCSLEEEENLALVKAFINSSDNSFKLIKAEQSLPFESWHDGAGVFVLQRLK